MKKLSLFFALLTVTASAQTTDHRTFDLQTEYGVTWQHDHTLSQHGYSYAQAKAKFPAWVGYCEYAGWSQSEVLSTREIVAAFDDAEWRSDGYFTEMPYYPNGMQSRCNIILPHGHFSLDQPLIFGQGIIEGQGAGNYASGGNSTGGTVLELDNANWKTSRFPERLCMRSSTWGDNGSLGYAETFTIRHIRFYGGKDGSLNDASYTAAGIGIWDAGEASGVEYCYAIGFNSYGFMSVRGTPSTFRNCSAFSNGLFGFGLIGNDLSTVTIICPSGDDNGALVGVRGGYDRPGGGTVTIIGAKSESGKRTPYRKQKLFDGQGAINLNVEGAWVHAIDGPTAVISCDFQTFNGGVSVHGLRHDGYSTALSITKGSTVKTYASPGSYAPYDFVANETGLVWASRSMGGSTPVDPGPIDPGPVDPPPSSGNSFGPFTMTSTTCVQVNVPNVTKVKITGLVAKSVNWGRICGTGNNGPSLQIYPTGHIYFNGKRVSTQKVQVNVPYSAELTIPSSTITALWQTDCQQGGAVPGTCEKLELY